MPNIEAENKEEPQTVHTCNAQGYCHYKAMGSLGFTCRYDDFCPYQLPPKSKTMEITYESK